MTRTLIVGYGYLGRRVAELAVDRGDSVWGTSRNPEKLRKMRLSSIEPLAVDWTDRRTLVGLPEVDRVLVAVSYDRQSRPSRFDSQVGGLRNLLGAVSPTAHICYISTTGVYHQTGGVWVDETSSTRPDREGGQVHLQAESLLQRMRPHDPWTILRLSGIYGPGRVPRAADVIAQRPIASSPTGFLNLIHVDDAAVAVLASWTNSTRRLYVVSDDEPIMRAEFYRQIARQSAAPPPTFTRPAADAPPRMRSESNKRVWNRRMKRDLVPKLTFPTYLEGLTDVLSRGADPFHR